MNIINLNNTRIIVNTHTECIYYNPIPFRKNINLYGYQCNLHELINITDSYIPICSNSKSFYDYYDNEMDCYTIIIIVSLCLGLPLLITCCICCCDKFKK
jgi:hypothetical protein